MKMRVLALAASAFLLALTGCSSGGDSLAAQWQEASDKGYIAGDGSTTSIAPQARTQPVVFEGVGVEGESIKSLDFNGSVTVVNFWYAGCAPCRAEAADLVASFEEFETQDVKFLGVNTRDGEAAARGFEQEYKVPYPSILDTLNDRSAQRAFAGQIPLNAVPTTLILDREGRVAHRILGRIIDSSQLRTLINETLAE